KISSDSNPASSIGAMGSPIHVYNSGCSGWLSRPAGTNSFGASHRSPTVRPFRIVSALTFRTRQKSVPGGYSSQLNPKQNSSPMLTNSLTSLATALGSLDSGLDQNSSTLR